jgi:hypothetical protein
MNKTLATILVMCSAIAAFGQGAVDFSNNTLSRLSIGGPYPMTEQVPLTPGLLEYGLFYGIGQSTSLTFLSSQLGVNSTTGLGLIASPLDSKTTLSNVPLPGTSPAETDVWIGFKAWSASFGSDWAAAEVAFNQGVVGVYWGESQVRNVNALGNPSVAGVSIWEAATGTNSHQIPAFAIFTVIPEPSTFVLAGLGTGLLLIRLRRK